jgi:hypothetical protein
VDHAAHPAVEAALGDRHDDISLAFTPRPLLASGVSSSLSVISSKARSK